MNKRILRTATRAVHMIDAAKESAEVGLYGPAAQYARTAAEMVRPVSPTLGALWDQAASTWHARRLPALRLFDEEE